MSFILQAIKKRAVDIPNSISSTASTPVNSVTFQSNFIGWGILLTLAIFIALTIGYWFGDRQALNHIVRVNNAGLSNEHAASLPTIKPIVKPTLSANKALLPATPTNSTAMQPASANIERYFDHPQDYQPAVNNHTPEQFNNTAKPAIKLSVKAVPGVSAQLLSQVQSAIEETADKPPVNVETVHQAKKVTIPSLAELPESIKQQLPKLHFSLHIYASDGQSWVRANGVDSHQGDSIAAGVTLVKIEPQQVILQFHQQQFSMPALTNWR